MTELEFQKEKETIQKRACHLRRTGTPNRDIGRVMGLSADQYHRLFKIEPLTLTERRNRLRKPIIQKSVSISPKKNRTKSPIRPWDVLRDKLLRFTVGSPEITCHQVIDRFGVTPTCYLTGRPIEYDDPSTYQLDHFVARSKGGDNTLQNLRLSHPLANRMKSGLSYRYFVDFCREITAKADRK